MFPYPSFRCSKQGILTAESIAYPENAMVGKQAEFCFETYLKYSENYRILAATIQIQGETETLGELDYLVFDIESKQTLHIELACKFYVYDASNSSDLISRWIGPNRKDTLREKLTKFQEKQFPLLFKPETKKVLDSLAIEATSITQQMCLKAFLFIPKHLQKETFSNEFRDCIVGYWIRFAEFIPESKTALYAIPKKKEWLLHPQNSTEWVSFSEIQKEIKTHLELKKSPLVYKRDANKTERLFIVWW